MMKKFFLTFSIILLLSPAAFSYQFEDFTWGTPMAEIKAQYPAAQELEDTLVIRGEAFQPGPSGVVSFCFTPESKLLFKIVVEFTPENAPESLEKNLTEKWGPPLKSSKELYIWQDEADDKIELSLSKAGVVLTYLSGEYTEVFEKEEENTFQDE
jgi:hypothetical protein